MRVAAPAANAGAAVDAGRQRAACVLHGAWLGGAQPDAGTKANPGIVARPPTYPCPLPPPPAPPAAVQRAAEAAAGGRRGRVVAARRRATLGKQAGARRARPWKQTYAQLARLWPASPHPPIACTHPANVIVAPGATPPAAGAPSGALPAAFQEWRSHPCCGLPGSSPNPLRAFPRCPQKPSASSDFWYDVAGWACLVGIVFGVAALSRTAAASGPSA